MVRAQLMPDGPLPILLHPALEMLCAEIVSLDTAIAAIDRQLAALAEQMLLAHNIVERTRAQAVGQWARCALFHPGGFE